MVPSLPTLVLVPTIGWLYASGLPVPIQLTALCMVGLILRVFIRRDDNRFARMEAQLAEVQAEAQEQHHLKHLLANQITARDVALKMILPPARACTCDVMTPYISTLEFLAIPAAPKEPL